MASTASRQVKFDFDVYRGSSTAGTFVPKNTWTSVAENTQFYLPTWVPEGRYEFRFRSTAINAAAIIVNFDITTVEDGKLNLSYINEKNSSDGYCNM